MLCVLKSSTLFEACSIQGGLEPLSNECHLYVFRVALTTAYGTVTYTVDYQKRTSHLLNSKVKVVPNRGHVISDAYFTVNHLATKANLIMFPPRVIQHISCHMV